MELEIRSQRAEEASAADKIAKLVRFVTVPPLVVTAVMTILYFCEDVFPTALDYALTVLFLGFLPVLAYPLQKLVPAWRRGGRAVQRRLAFVITPLGYAGAVITAVLRRAIPNLLYISVVYLLSVVLLLLFNKLTPLRASGHACGLAGTVILPCLFIGWQAILPGVLLFGLAFWASVRLGRHTAREFLLGASIAALSAFVCFFFIHPSF